VRGTVDNKEKSQSKRENGKKRGQTSSLGDGATGTSRDGAVKKCGTLYKKHRSCVIEIDGGEMV